MTQALTPHTFLHVLTLGKYSGWFRESVEEKRAAL